MSITSLVAIAPVLGKGEVECSIHSGSTTAFVRVRLPRCSECVPSRPTLHRPAANHLCVVPDRLQPANEMHLNFVAVFAGEKFKLLFGLHASIHHRDQRRMIVAACRPWLRLAIIQLQVFAMLPKRKSSAWL